MYKRLSWIAVILCMAAIFHFSHQPAEKSDNLSKGITKTIVEKVEKVSPEKEFNLRKANQVVRKNAHFFIYLVLGALLLKALNRSKVYGIRAITFALTLSVLFAISDELHQLFVPGRGAQVSDVLIDSAGAITGIGLYLLFKRIVKTCRHLSMTK
ncbi:VanZ family protein [Bacillus nitroreducens]